MIAVVVNPWARVPLSYDEFMLNKEWFDHLDKTRMTIAIDQDDDDDDDDDDDNSRMYGVIKE